MVIHNPPHLGEAIREFCLEPLGLSVTAAAAGLGVSRKTLSELLNGYQSTIVRNNHHLFECLTQSHQVLYLCH